MFSGFFQCDNMKKKYSLKRNEEIALLIQQKQFVKNNCYVLYYKENLENENFRICISVSKKNGIAVVRNKIKRQIRSMIDDIFEINKKFDYVLIVRNDFLLNDYSFNKVKLNELYQKIGGYKNEKKDN